MANSIRYILFIMQFLLFISTVQAATKITVLKTPNGGVQPQAVVDDKDNLHLIYFSGDAMGGNLFYVSRLAGKEEFSKPIQVNSVQGSAVSAGTIRGGQIALGKNNRVHVSWNGTKTVKGNMEYARLNDDSTAFEAEQGLMQETINLDGGGSMIMMKDNVPITYASDGCKDINEFPDFRCGRDLTTMTCIYDKSFRSVEKKDDGKGCEEKKTVEVKEEMVYYYNSMVRIF